MKAATLQLNGMPVTFHKSPLIGVPDFPWVDILQLAAALDSPYPDDAIVRLCQRFPDGGDLVKAVSFEGSIVTIVAHPIAQGLAGALDNRDGADRADGGPKHNAYSDIAAQAMRDHFKMPLEDAFAAFRRHNTPG
ncbi:hypothetical protein [Sulfitobacter sp. CS16]|uniref:hypothetical protein n=1 Tax=Sulfitobacter sp. CS16 TaxID=3368573 RepID=UPI003745E202